MYVKLALVALVTLMAIRLSGGPVTGPGAGPVSDATCDALDQYLPTWSADDTEETLASGDRFLDVYEEVCD